MSANNPRYEMLSMRCVVEAVTPPVVTVRHAWDREVFTLMLGVIAPEQVAAAMGREADILVGAVYLNGAFQSGVIESFRLVEDTDFWPRWKAWAAENPGLALAKADELRADREAVAVEEGLYDD